MIREEEIKHASKDYVNYLLDKQEYHNEKYTEYDIKQAFEKGAEWADKNLNSKTIAEYLYKEKGYPISLNRDIPTYEEVVKHIQAYNNYKRLVMTLNPLMQNLISKFFGIMRVKNRKVIILYYVTD